MRFEWDDEKNRTNLRKHDVRFETATLAFEDPFALTQRDMVFDDEERWVTIGAIEAGVLLFVAHTFNEEDEEEVIRIISARAAESHERRAYEEAHKRTAKRYSRRRRQNRRRD